MRAPSDLLFTDIHCHLLPEIDDGPKDWEASLAMARMAVANGIRTIVATPHQLGRYESNTADQILSLTAEAQRRIHGAELPLTVLPGADVRVQEDLPELLDKGQVLTLGATGNDELKVMSDESSTIHHSSLIGGPRWKSDESTATHHSSLVTHHYLLMELPHEQVLPMGRLLYRLQCQGVTGILSHPERNKHLQENPEILRPWVQQGCLIQVTAASITGTFGREAQRVSRWLLAENLVHLVATDAHDVTRRRPEWREAFAKVCQWESRARAELIVLRNPEAVVRGQPVDAPLPSSQSRTGFASWFNSTLATLRG